VLGVFLQKYDCVVSSIYVSLISRDTKRCNYMNKWMVILFFIGQKCMAHVEAENEINRVTIFVHGTHRTASALGQIPGVGVYVNHKQGLYKPDECPQEYVYRRLANIFSLHSPLEFPAEHFYLFCWSGILSHEARFEAARGLHKALNDLVNKYKNKCVITLVTHSHGGNVALNLPNVGGAYDYVIENLILLAVPVQKNTEGNVEDLLFKNVYSLYSRWDLIQIGDPQGFGYSRRMIRKVFTRAGQERGDLEEVIPFFSQRIFLSARVKHIEICQATLLGNRPIGHIEFLLPHFINNISSILKKASQYDFHLNDPMIFNIERSCFYLTYFDNR
jgi:hypothetical protein